MKEQNKRIKNLNRSKGPTKRYSRVEIAVSPLPSIFPGLLRSDRTTARDSAPASHSPVPNGAVLSIAQTSSAAPRSNNDDCLCASLSAAICLLDTPRRLPSLSSTHPHFFRLVKTAALLQQKAAEQRGDPHFDQRHFHLPLYVY
jgi:hypothetical protein